MTYPSPGFVCQQTPDQLPGAFVVEWENKYFRKMRGEYLSASLDFD
ncbi:MAG: hypothetical protein MI976_06250 [Pseudomonadales bacterium]|nr:hypothetical protein [Pseudomonadales bacterium]